MYRVQVDVPTQEEAATIADYIEQALEALALPESVQPLIVVLNGGDDR